MFTTGKALWLGVQPKLSGEGEQPRVPLVAVPYALKAADADTLGGKTAEDFVHSRVQWLKLKTLLDSSGDRFPLTREGPEYGDALNHLLAPPKRRVQEPDDQEMAAALALPPQEVRAWKGRGCVECNQRGYRGRVAIYEFFLLNEALADLIRPGLRTAELRQAARQLGWRSLREMAWFKVQRGLIPITEQDRWTRLIDPAILTEKAKG
jgi:hypothetical protein